MNNEFRPEKSKSTEADFDKMGWHDCTVHALGFYPEAFELAFDIDYINKWIEPTDKHYNFWLSPCTLVFRYAWDVKLDLEGGPGTQILGVTRSEERVPRNSDATGERSEWLWELECVNGIIKLRSPGFSQYTRKKPVHCGAAQSLNLEERGGLSFDRRNWDSAT